MGTEPSLERPVPAPWVLMLIVVMVAGAALRFHGLDWDDSNHLHPDERSLTIIGPALEFPDSWADYLDVGKSRLSPYNLERYGRFTYGTLPLFVTKLVASRWGNPSGYEGPRHRDHYGQIHLVGRFLSAALDTLTILLVFLAARGLSAGRPPRLRFLVGIDAAAFYAFCVTAIQHAHFFTVESWLVCSGMATFLLATSISNERNHVLWRLIPLLMGIGIAFAVTVSCKISGLLMLPPVLVALVGWGLRPAASARTRLPAATAETCLASLVLFGTAFVSYRLLSPYSFGETSWLDWSPHPGLVRSLSTEFKMLGGDYLWPPSYQWFLSTPILSPLENLVVWALGVPLGASALFGLYLMGGDHLRRPLHQPPRLIALMLLVFVATTFLYAASRFNHSIRYLLPLAPLLSVCAAYVFGRAHDRRPLAAALGGAAVLVATASYALAFSDIYANTSTRVAATEWIVRNVPEGTPLVNEHWDDALPLANRGRYPSSLNPVFEPDDRHKLRKLYDAMEAGEYYVLSSPRAWRTIGRLPERFPIMVRFYQLLFAGELGFVETARFESGPRLFGKRISTLSAEESFWVYDHPPVIVFRRDFRLGWSDFQWLFADLVVQ